MMLKKWGHLVLVLGAMVLVASCGSSDTTPPQTPIPADVQATLGAVGMMSSVLATLGGAPPVVAPASDGEPAPIDAQVQAILDHTRGLGGGLARPLSPLPLTGNYGCLSSGSVDIVGSADVTDTFSGGYGTFTIVISGMTADFNACSNGLYSVAGGLVTMNANDSITVSNPSPNIDRYVVSFDESMSGSGITITNLSTAQAFTVTFSSAANVSMDFTFNTSTSQFTITTYSVSYQITVNGQTCTVTATPSGQSAVCSG